MGHMFSNWVFVLTGFEGEGTSSGGDVVQTSTQEEREVEEEGCSTCEELKAQITSLVEKNNQLEGRLQVEKDLHQKDMEDLQARYSRTKNEKEKLVEEIKKLKEKQQKIFHPPLTVIWLPLQNLLFFGVLQPFKVCSIQYK